MENCPIIYKQICTFHPNFQNDDRYLQDIDTSLAKWLCMVIVTDQGTTINKGTHCERRLELAVAPVDEFWRIVREEAMSYAAQEIQKLETEITNLKKEQEESIRRAVIHEKSQGRW